MAWPQIIAGIGSLVGGQLDNMASLPLQDYWRQEEMNFNRNEARIQREFEADQAQINRDWQTNANRVAMDFSAQQAQAQRDWESQMSSSAISRQYEDLKNTGLNPILAAQFMGASTPSGASASGYAQSAGGVPNGATAHVNSQLPKLSHSNMYKVITDIVGDHLSSAREMARDAERFQNDMEKLYQKNELDKDYFDYTHNRGAYSKK